MNSYSDVDVCQDDLMPYQRKERDPDVGDAINAVMAAHAALRVNAEERHAGVLARTAAIQTALGKGATFTELADQLGVSIERVRQMAKQVPKGPK